MNKEQIKHAAEEDSLWFAIRENEDKESLYKAAFTAGAEWRINSVWHGAKEMPDKCDYILLCGDGVSPEVILYTLDDVNCRAIMSGYEKWAYVDDLRSKNKQ